MSDTQKNSEEISEVDYRIHKRSRCEANIWKGGEGGRCTRNAYDYCSYCHQHELKALDCPTGGELRDGKAYGLYFGHILDGASWEDMVQWAKNLTKAKSRRARPQ